MESAKRIILEEEKKKDEERRIITVNICIERFGLYKDNADIRLENCHQYNKEKYLAIRDSIQSVLDSLIRLKKLL